MNAKPVQPLIETINKVLQDGTSKGIKHIVPGTMRRHLAENVYIFSGAKTNAQLRELSSLLSSEDGSLKPFSKFWKDAQKLHPKYNAAYLEAEYIYATQAAQMASKWSDFEQHGDRYNLQYRTAADARVRDTHAILHNTTLAASDPFWDKYFPPNGWRCRCTVVQVRKSKYPESDSIQAQENGSLSTEGKNSIFRFNPGKQQVIFPEHHPYFKRLTDKEYEVIKDKAKEVFSVKTADDVVKIISDVSKDKGWFEHGFSKLDVTNVEGLNGSTNRKGTISLNKDKMEKTISGINKLSNGNSKDVTFEESDAMSTFWHEITHNRNKKGIVFLAERQTNHMELANEFISRKTLSEFFEAFGAKVQHPELIKNRTSTGYNAMVNNFQKIIDKTKLDKDKVVGVVKEHLFNEWYTDQKDGLTNALKGAKKADGKAIKKAEINSLIEYCVTLDEDIFEKYLQRLIRYEKR